jgi:hypothetical protein
MTNSFERHFHNGQSDSAACRAEDGRSWLANAIINSIAAKPRADGQDPTVHAPAVIRYFGAARRNSDRSALSSVLRAGFLSVVCAMLLLPGESGAQARCGEGKTASGQCVDVRLAANARQAAIIFSQPKISQTAYPVLPSLDVNYRYPNQLIPDSLKSAATGTPAPN